MAKTRNDTPWRDAIVQVMQESGEPMHYGDITDKIIAQKLRKSLGATPASTVASYLSDKRQSDLFTRVAPGMYALSSNSTLAIDTATIATARDSADTQQDILPAFGMFWRRELIDWKCSSHILGCQKTGSDPVDFCGQIGIYLLYDGREVIYVGRSTDRPLGVRLYEHTRDRLASRWDRFSWFGVLPVSEDGKLGKQPTSYSNDALIPALEALLIEALEPRQNRKRGDDISAMEFIQYEDPSLRKTRLKSEMSKILDDE